MGRSRRDMLMLLAALSLVTGFFALGPLYLRALGESGLKYAIDHARPRDLTLTLTSDSPFDLADRPVIAAELGDISGGVESLTVMQGVVCNNIFNGLCFGDENFRAYIPVAYERLSERFTIIDGVFPAADGETAVTGAIAQEMEIGVGDVIEFYPDTPQRMTVTIVGILEPIMPDDRFWIGQQAILYGQLVDVTENFQRFDMGIIFTEAAYTAQIIPIAPSGTRYDWYVETNLEALRAAGLSDLTTSFDNIERYFRRIDSEFQLVGGLYTLVTEYQTDLRAVEGTVILCAVGVLVLLFYQLMMTTALILERQSIEWSSISSRGGSPGQLIRMQAGTMAILCALAFVIGLPVAYAILLMVGTFSPLSNVIGGGIALTTMPIISIVLSGAASIAALIALTIPAVPAARTSLLRLKQSISRPPTQPAWTRYFLDLTLIALGVILLLRLYFLFGGTSLEALARDPAALLRVITANAAQDAGLLNDPFNLAAAAVLITGLTLFWLRLFPLLMRLIGAFLSRSNGLSAPLALWNIARDPGHYAQLVMVMIGTLAIGTASLALAATHDAGAWSTAQFVTGGDVTVTFAAEAPPDAISEGAETIMRYQTIEPRAITPTTIIGVSAERFNALGGENTGESAESPGIPLPEEAVSLSIQVYAEPIPDGLIHTRLAVEVVNQLGVARTIPLITADDTVTGQFVTYAADLPGDTHLPYVFTGVRYQTRTESEFNGVDDHVVYLDDVAYTTADGTQVIFEDFERSTVLDWIWRNNQIGSPGSRLGLFAGASQSHSASGDYGLRTQYSIVPLGARLVEPLLGARPLNVEPYLPILISPLTARLLADGILNVGDRGELALNMAEGARELRYQVIGIIPEFPSAGDRFLIAPAADLIPFLNAAASPESYYAVNTVSLMLPDRQLDSETRARLEALPGVVEIAEAWDTFNLYIREPLPNAIIGVLYAGFWVSLILGLLDFGFYLAMTTSRRASSFAVLRAFGWQGARVWGLLTIEQAALVLPALVIGLGLGGMLAYLLLPFLALFGDEALRFPLGQIGVLLFALVIGFAVLLIWAAFVITRMSVGQALRLSEE